MSAQARLTRLLALVPWLVAHDGVTIRECAAHFGVTEEVLQEDLWQLVVCGLPGYGPDQLVDIQFWDDDDAVRGDGVIRVVDPQTLDRPMRLEPPGGAGAAGGAAHARPAARARGQRSHLAGRRLQAHLPEGLPSTVFKGQHVRHPSVRTYSGRALTIDAPGHVVYADGERIGPLPVEIRMHPGVLRVLAC